MVNKFMIGLADLKRAVLFNRSVTSGKNLSDNEKNIIFSAHDGVVTASAHVAGIDGSIDITPQDYEVEDTWNFQVRSSSIMHLLKSYSNLTYTFVSGVTFQESKASVQIIVHEEVKDEDTDPRFAQDGQYRIGTAPITDKVLTAVSKTFDDDSAVGVSSIDIDIYIRDLIKLVNNDKSAGARSQINIGEDYAFVHSTTTSSAYLHTLPEEFHNISLSYPQALSLLMLNDSATGKQLDENLTSDEDIQELESDEFSFAEDEDEDAEETDGVGDIPTIEAHRVSKNVISFKYEDTRLFLTVSPVKLRYKNYFDPAFEKNDEGAYANRSLTLSVDRLYFKNVLKRLSFDGDSVMFKVEDNMLIASTKSMSHSVPVTDFTGEIKQIGFKLLPAAIERMIIGNDAEYASVEGGEDVLLVFNPTERGYQLHVLDGLNAWVSASNIQKA